MVCKTITVSPSSGGAGETTPDPGDTNGGNGGTTDPNQPPTNGGDEGSSISPIEGGDGQTPNSGLNRNTIIALGAVGAAYALSRRNR